MEFYSIAYFKEISPIQNMCFIFHDMMVPFQKMLAYFDIFVQIVILWNKFNFSYYLMTIMCNYSSHVHLRQRQDLNIVTIY